MIEPNIISVSCIIILLELVKQLQEYLINKITITELFLLLQNSNLKINVYRLLFQNHYQLPSTFSVKDRIILKTKVLSHDRSAVSLPIQRSQKIDKRFTALTMSLMRCLMVMSSGSGNYCSNLSRLWKVKQNLANRIHNIWNSLEIAIHPHFDLTYPYATPPAHSKDIKCVTLLEI